MFLFKWALILGASLPFNPLMDDACRHLYTWNNFYRKLLYNSFKCWPFLEVCCANIAWAVANPLAFVPAARCCWSFRMALAQSLGRSLWTHPWSCTSPLHLTGKHLENLSACQPGSCMLPWDPEFCLSGLALLSFTTYPLNFLNCAPSSSPLNLGEFNSLVAFSLSSASMCKLVHILSAKFILPILSLKCWSACFGQTKLSVGPTNIICGWQCDLSLAQARPTSAALLCS